MAISQGDYFLKQGESIPQYNVRIAALRSQQGAVTSSTPYRDTTQQNTQQFQQMTSQPVPTQYQQPTQQLTQQTTQTAQQPTQQGQQVQQAVQATSPNQQLQSIINQTNQIISQAQTQGYQLTPQQQTTLNQINGLDASQQAMVAQAQTSLQQDDTYSFNKYMEQIRETQKQRDSQMTQLFQEMRNAQQGYLTSLQPDQATTDLQTQLADLQTQQGQYELDTQKRQEAQFGKGRPLSISQGFATKEAKEASFGRQELALQEANLLTKLGFAQEARKMTQEGSKANLTFMMKNAEFAQKIFDSQAAQEDRVFERFQQYTTMQRQQSADVLDSLKGQDPTKFSVDTQNRLSQIAQRIGVGASDLIGALQTNYDSMLLDQSVKKANIQKTLNDVSQGFNLGEVDINDPNYILNLMAKSAGGKKPNQVETIRPLQKATTVMSQLGELSSLVAKTKTDPIIGTIRSMNPYDFDARAIQATLQATVPNLARGVYGEVGVLTDNDIRNYIKTLPNIKSTAAQNKFVMGMTLRSLQRGFESQLEVLAAAGYDVSGFKNVYQRMNNTAQKIESELGISGTPPDDVLRNEFNSLQSGKSPTQNDNYFAPVENFFGSFLNQLFK